MIKRLIDRFDSIQFPMWVEYLGATIFAVAVAILLALFIGA